MLTLPDYTLIELLHEGSATILYRGVRSADGSRVAIKLLKTEYPSMRELARFKHEYMLTRDLDAPGVVKAYGLSKSSAGLALVLEDFGGRALSDVLRARRLPLRAALEIAVAVADALAAIHDRRIVHRDIKPHNILVSAEPFAVKLTDFGIAVRLADGAPWNAGVDVMEGTLAYMSPEQTGRMNGAVDHRSDLYSFGVTLYEMLTDALPFQAADQAEMVHSHIARTPMAPRARSPEIPEVVSAIVMRLLAKTAEDRYQSAHGLKADLEECLSRLEGTGVIDPFPLGQGDAPREIRIPETLYGRGAEVAAILAAFEGVREEGVRVVLVAGPAGIGKSALIAHAEREIVARGGLFVLGKSHQLRQNIPYAAVASALRELVRQILAEPAEAVARWKRELLAALGGQGQIVVDLIPELAWLLGPQPAMPLLGPAEARNRFSMVFQSFIRAVAGRARPLLIFLDDLQWIDPASLKVVSLLLGDPESAHLLFVCAYRDREIGAGHLIAPILGEIRARADRVDEIAIRPFDLQRVTELVKDTVGGDGERVLPLAQLLFDKTAGNPFFLGQILKALHADGRLTFDPGTGSFRWDLDRIKATIGAADVAERTAEEILRLPPEARRALEIAACIGQKLDAKTLAGALGVTLDQAQRDLLPSEEAGILVSALVEREDRPGAGAPPSFDVVYRFTRERAQEAVYAAIDGRRRQEIHLRIGKILSADDPHGERIFDVVDHLNRGSAGIVDRREQIDLARRNQAAAERAKAATAYQSAVTYYQAGARVLGEAIWDEDEALAFAIHLGLAECEHLTGDVEAAEARFDLLLAHARTAFDRARVYDLMIVLFAARGDFASVTRVGEAALALFGVALPASKEAQQAAVEAALAAAIEKLEARSIEEIALVPATADPEQIAVRSLLAKLSAPLFVASPLLYVLDILFQVDRCFTYGHSGLSCFAFSTCALLLAGTFGRAREARRAFLVARDVEPRFDSAELRCKNLVVLANCAHYFEPHRKVDGYFARARAAGPMSGDFTYLSYAYNLGAIHKLLIGEDLGAVREDVIECLAVLRRTHDARARSFIELERQVIYNLEGRTAGRATLSDEGFDEAAFLEKITSQGFTLTVAFHHAMKLMLLVIHGERALALAAVAPAVEGAKRFGGLHFTLHVPFFAGLALAAAIPSASPEDRARYFAELGAHRATLSALAELCPENYRHMDLLLGAEAARVEGRGGDARELYDEAIAAAEAQEIRHHAAIAHELAGLFYLEKDKRKVARLYLAEAQYGYLRWGATAKASELAAQHPDLLGAGRAPAASSPELSVTTTTDKEGGDRLDTVAMMRAAQAIAGEIELSTLLEKLMRIVVESAGATSGALLLERDGQLFVEATMSVEPEIVRLGMGTPLDEDADLATSVVRFVQRTGEVVAIGDAARAGAFAADPHLLAHPHRSILGLAMLHQGRLIGVLYLENQAAREAFTPARVEVVRVLAAQAAIAVENATMVAELRRRTDALSQAKERLEQELADRALAEAARQQLKEELNRVQTPIIPITDRVMVMPLIGAIDAERARQVLETALAGAQKSRARVVILDVTGVERVDAGVTGTLVSTASALRLLGAQAVITGIRPDVAQALVALNVDLSAVVTLGTLESGIAYAMDRLKSRRL